MNRRELVQKIAVGGTVFLFVPSIIQSCSKDTTTNPSNTPPTPGTKINLDLTQPDNSALNTVGGSLIVQTILVINTGSGNYAALTSVCTHAGCTVGYDSTAGKIVCPCHGSVYATTGSVLTGPAPTALTTYPATKTGNILTISI